MGARKFVLPRIRHLVPYAIRSETSAGPSDHLRPTPRVPDGPLNRAGANRSPSAHGPVTAFLYSAT